MDEDKSVYSLGLLLLVCVLSWKFNKLNFQDQRVWVSVLVVAFISFIFPLIGMAITSVMALVLLMTNAGSIQTMIDTFYSKKS